MIIEKYKDDIRYTLSNENLKVGDKVYPILTGRVTDDEKFIIHEIEYESNFPDKPHTIRDLNNSDFKPFQVRTNKGYSPIEKYFKIVKKEKCHIETTVGHSFNLKEVTWIEI